MGIFVLILTYLLFLAPLQAAPSSSLDAGQTEFFEKNIRPVLTEKCYHCHSASAEKLKGGLLLDTREGIRRGGDSGHAVVPNSLDESLLIKAIRYSDEDLRMPPEKAGGKLPDDVIHNFETWINMGAPDPRDGPAAMRQPLDPARARDFWSFQPPKSTSPPKVADTNWPGSDIDRFIRAAQEAKGLKPVYDADRRSLIRRLFFDLLGLPPRPDQVEAFIHSQSPAEALTNLVDRLLASPQFGERWGRHWLDLARYAESTGKERNFAYSEAWRYRDYVISSFYKDKPYDQFIREQIAGDLLPAKNNAERNEHLIATGFLAIGPKSLNEGRNEQFLMDQVDEQIDVTSRSVLGLTVSCARCHDHKFDPIPTRDYYALAGIFRSTDVFYGTGSLPQNRHPSTLIPLAGATARTNRVAQVQPTRPLRVSEDGDAGSSAKDPNKKKRRQQQLQKMESPSMNASTNGAPAPYVDSAMGVQDGKIRNHPILIRGEIGHRGEVVPRGFVSVITAAPPKLDRQESGRLELAEWLTSRDNPLAARVMVNRVWEHLFGEGLVRTADNFGSAGERPSHPELLDYLAVRFMENNWSVKKLIRMIVLSRVYQLSSTVDAKDYEADPDNLLLWRATPRRLDAEALRDAILSASGSLDLTPPHGSSVQELGDAPIRPARASRVLNFSSTKRSVYLPIIRGMVPDVLSLFDFAEPSLLVASRDVTSVPAQSLFMMNSPFVSGESEAMARRLLRSPLNANQRITAAYLRTLARPPTSRELARAIQYLQQQTPRIMQTPGTTAEEAGRTAWATFCQVLFASAEFRYLK